jgi:hypothetical protein
MTSHYPITRRAPETAWTDPQSYRDQIDYYENVALHYRREARKAKWLGRFGFANRARQASPRAVLHRLGHTVPIAIAVLCILYFVAEFLR